MDAAQDLGGFSKFVADRIATGEVALPEECVALWRAEHPLPDELAQSVEDLRRSLEDVAHGRMTDFDEVNAAVRREHGWASG